MRTVGVEEEFLLLDAHRDDSRPTAAEVLLLATPLTGQDGTRSGTATEGSLVAELKQQQLESNSSPHTTMSSLVADLSSWRRKAATAAERAGARLLASGTSPVPVVPLQVHTDRYDRMDRQFGLLSREHLTCGCHVHVAVDSDEEAVGVLDRIRAWLPVLLALSANSPLWQGGDSDYASWRTQVMGRWPGAGPIDVLGSADRYHALVESMIRTGVLLDDGMVYFDARVSVANPTVEIRVPDVCLDVGDTILVASLTRALVETAARAWAAGEAPPDVPSDLIRLATWRASRFGIDGDLLDPLACTSVAPRSAVGALVEHVREALRDAGDEELVTHRIERLFTLGNGARRQRRALQESGLDGVVEMLVVDTVAGA
ncbi:carboxylate-amine ligase [Nocardioides jiangxiensis]|uniref:Putative glutamate--cysteine ligase 2 n=1 Tax=Nocardioides jiangxiensis TaxID=3064524 RepID=A0ABT9B199_9ACTN|nr:glutamate--cysteine ligase [Nocardioides sp. WY-20]MDO7867046.1 glutamate--cysteine ligase [Nocardioides sp. WY-20]